MTFSLVCIICYEAAFSGMKMSIGTFIQVLSTVHLRQNIHMVDSGKRYIDGDLVTVLLSHAHVYQ